MSDRAISWQIGESAARLHAGPLEGLLEWNRTGGCFIPTAWNSQSLSRLELLCSTAPVEFTLAELYVRGDDLVVEGNPAGSDCIAPQIYWRGKLVGDSQAVRLELVLSVRTELLDSRPTWQVHSSIPGATLLHASSLAEPTFRDITDTARSFPRSESAEQLFVFRRADFGFSYAEMVHPSDFVSADTALKDVSVHSQLFPERLEKGVIRRGRICGWLLPSENDLTLAAQLARQFVDEPLPLTA
jgi:hypothetical protein